MNIFVDKGIDFFFIVGAIREDRGKDDETAIVFLMAPDNAGVMDTADAEGMQSSSRFHSLKRHLFKWHG